MQQHRIRRGRQPVARPALIQWADAEWDQRLVRIDEHYGRLDAMLSELESQMFGPAAEGFFQSEAQDDSPPKLPKPR